MNRTKPPFKIRHFLLLAAMLEMTSGANAADQELLDILLANGAITQEQYDGLLERDTLTSDDILPEPVEQSRALDEAVSVEVSRQIEERLPVAASQESS